MTIDFPIKCRGLLEWTIHLLNHQGCTEEYTIDFMDWKDEKCFGYSIVLRRYKMPVVRNTYINQVAPIDEKQKDEQCKIFYLKMIDDYLMRCHKEVLEINKITIT